MLADSLGMLFTYRQFHGAFVCVLPRTVHTTEEITPGFLASDYVNSKERTDGSFVVSSHPTMYVTCPHQRPGRRSVRIIIFNLSVLYVRC